MARTFGSYSPTVPGGTTWEEELQLVDANDEPIDLTDYVGRAHLRLVIGQEDPSLELTSANTRIVIPTQTGDDIGVMRITVAHDDVTALLDGGTTKLKYLWDIELRNENVTPHYVIPVVKGKVTIEPRVTR